MGCRLGSGLSEVGAQSPLPASRPRPGHTTRILPVSGTAPNPLKMSSFVCVCHWASQVRTAAHKALKAKHLKNFSPLSEASWPPPNPPEVLSFRGLGHCVSGYSSGVMSGNCITALSSAVAFVPYRRELGSQDEGTGWSPGFTDVVLILNLV